MQLAGIGRVESNHGRFAGAVLHSDGVSIPRIIGIPLNGNGTAVIVDTDGGRLDGDSYNNSDSYIALVLQPERVYANGAVTVPVLPTDPDPVQAKRSDRPKLPPVDPGTPSGLTPDKPKPSATSAAATTSGTSSPTTDPATTSGSGAADSTATPTDTPTQSTTTDSTGP